jgi:rod shape-determining protein MreD
MSWENLKYYLWGLLFLAIQVVFLQHLVLFGASADLVFLFVLWAMLKVERSQVLLIAFGLAFFQDALLDHWGLNILSKTLFAYVFYNIVSSFRDTILSVGQVFLFILVAALIYHMIYLGIANFAGRYFLEGMFLQMWLVGSSYTALVGIISHLLRTR